ncbi:hypothetical protein CAL22_13560 [Bordetella genomosp. 12]|uniref:HTH lysR-type domain-containing protein n=2 Tax=Bordetella genomosp. 12 TaxID=463035 RepID=A0A261VAY3_9BORD|nr:hypothetical protein CAL22_13560 [Bordetella genomosp. 12]
MITGSITEAAKMLFITQPSASRVLAAAETRLGFPLFDRAKGRLFPTPEARRIYREVEGAYAGVQRVDDIVRAISEGRSGRLNIVCSPSLGAHLVPRAIARFKQAHPNLPIHFEPLTYNNLVPRVLLGEDYLGVSMFPVASPNVQTQRLLDAPLVCIAPKGWLGPSEFVALDDLAGLPWIGYGHDTPLGEIVDSVFEGRALPEATVEVRSALSACKLVRENLGVAIVDPFCLDEEAKAAIDCRVLSPARSLSVSAIHSTDAPLSHAARMFVRTLEKILAAHLPA